MFILYSNPDESVCKTAKSSSEIYFLKVAATEELCDIFNDQNALQIILEGDPGSGKTTIVRETAYHWANSNILKGIKLLLIVNFLHKRPIKKLHEIIITYCKECKEKVAKRCGKYFEKLEGEGLMVILDDYYELQTMENHKFFEDLIQKKILPKCMLLMTTQSAINLHHSPIKQIQTANIKQIRIAKILGLTNKGIDEHYPSSVAHVNHLCHNPMNLKMYLSCSLTDPCITLSTQTDLVDKFICLNITHVSGLRDFTCNQNEFIAKVKLSLGQLAYEELIKDKLEFSEKIFKMYKFKKQYVTGALLKHVDDNKYKFAYAAIQYYLAAVYVVQNKLGDSIRYHQFWFGNNLHFLKFYASICSSQSLRLEDSFSAEGSTHVTKFLGIFKKFCRRKIDRLLLCFILSDVSSYYKTKIPIVHVVDGVKFSIDLSSEDLNLGEVNSLIYFIRNYDIIINWNFVDLSHCKLGDEGCKIFCESIALIHDYKNITIRSLNISGNCLNYRSLFALGNLVKKLKVQELTASHNDFTNGNFSSLADNQVEHLDLSSNQLDSRDVVKLCQALRQCQRLKKLALTNTCISNEAIIVLVTSIEKWNHFESLESDYTHINELLLFIKRNLLTTIGNTITFDSDVDSIKFFIMFLCYAKDIPDKDLDLILKVTKILNLSLQCTEYVMSENKRNTLTVGASEFFIKFKNLVTLNLSGIHIDEQASSGLARAFEGMQSLEHLIMNGCHLTSGVVIELLQALLRSSKLKEFHACSNSICDNATEALGIAILHWNSLRILNVIKNNRFTESGKSFLKFLLTHLHDSKCDGSLCISGISVKAFVTIMKNPTLQVKNLEMLENLTLQYFDNGIELDVYACKAFYRLIHLKELHLTNVIITSEAVFIIAYVLACKLDSLQSLTLCNCGLDSKNVLDIISTQSTAKLNAFQNLQKLDLSCNNITDKAVLSLITSFLQMPKLTEICMSDNQLVNYNIKEIAALLNDFRSSRSSIKFVSSYDNKHGLLSAFLTLLGCMKSIDATKSCQIKNFTMINELNIQNLHSKKGIKFNKEQSFSSCKSHRFNQVKYKRYLY